MRATRGDIETTKREAEAYRRQSNTGHEETRRALARAEAAEEGMRALRRILVTTVCAVDHHAPGCGGTECPCPLCAARDLAIV